MVMKEEMILLFPDKITYKSLTNENNDQIEDITIHRQQRKPILLIVASSSLLPSAR